MYGIIAVELPLRNKLPPSANERKIERHGDGRCRASPSICRSGPPKNGDAARCTMFMRGNVADAEAASGLK